MCVRVCVCVCVCVCVWRESVYTIKKGGVSVFLVFWSLKVNCIREAEGVIKSQGLLSQSLNSDRITLGFDTSKEEGDKYAAGG